MVKDRLSYMLFIMFSQRESTLKLVPYILWMRTQRVIGVTAQQYIRVIKLLLDIRLSAEVFLHRL